MVGKVEVHSALGFFLALDGLPLAVSVGLTEVRFGVCDGSVEEGGERLGLVASIQELAKEGFEFSVDVCLVGAELVASKHFTHHCAGGDARGVA